MREGHTISAPENEWKQVIEYANTNQKSISDVTRQAWQTFFKKPDNTPSKTDYRIVDIVTIILLCLTCLLIILGGFIL